MKKLHFSTLIQRPRAAVWDTMLGEETYRIWTADFCEGSYFEGSWKQGERMRFLAPNGDGMIAVIAESRLHEFISIKHIGMIAGGVEDTDSEQVRSWAPAFENYTFVREGGSTRLKIDIDVTPDFEQFMQDVWPKALARLKALCEED